jgi:peptidoglycan biosynthesis protein MviN/MurJ (putative lipid II flippase)
MKDIILPKLKRKSKNEKWETITKRQKRNDVIGLIVCIPMFYVLVILVCAI